MQELERIAGKSADTLNQFVELITNERDTIIKNGESENILRLALLLSESLNNRNIYAWAKDMLKE